MDYSLALNLLLSVPILLASLIWICSFFVAFVSVARIIFLSGMLRTPDAEKNLSWGENNARENAPGTASALHGRSPSVSGDWLSGCCSYSFKRRRLEPPASALRGWRALP
ncbi:hypothetical protein [Aminobacter sp. MET-1]|uniref:hypothetical protein n=1 Tax=Aminobacter sp. MET-1 TaxID=2951085 RepID=UPI00226AF59F|nr:hypothetical protein [Aminobacter sp. MET-1]MCX8572831.1 hypothetical protein [Aminobacter sp. MET-1]